jgi:2,4-dienoyl-CoA reductase-like NADH-dependent reductase (Old Yellow Enzyme family)
MRYTAPGRHKSLAAFREHWLRIAPDLGLDEELAGAAGPLGAPRAVAGRVAGNRFCIHPMEGWDGTHDGLPSEHTLRRWRNFGASGAKLVWGGEAFAVGADGRANPHQLCLNPAADTARGLAALLAATRAAHAEHGSTDDLVIGLQLTHSGRYARPEGPPAPKLACHHPVLDARFGVDPAAPLVSDAELAAIGERFVRAAELAQRLGFDFVDVKCCHGYLLHELLGARSRPGPYGGSFENRTRLFREIVAGIRAACPGLEIAVRVSLGDVFPHAPDPATGAGAPLGWERHVPYEHQLGVDRTDPRRPDFAEPLRFLALARDLEIRLVNVTLGSPYYCPHLQRPAAYPPSDGYEPPRDPLAEVAVHLCAVRAARAALPDLLLVGTGYTYLQEWLPHVAQHEVRLGHADFIGLGRMVLAYPELPRDVLASRPLDRKRLCRTFSDCTTAPRNGLVSGCYPLDPYYGQLADAARLKALGRRF